jgi:triacylglycerol esterase/lipase EstA (alpha/beta hydrolase family)
VAALGKRAVGQLIKVAGWSAGARLNVVFVHGLGGHAYRTWGWSTEGSTFWPEWLARDIPGLASWTLAYEAPATNWLGTAMPIQDRAKNVLECLLGCRELRGVPLVFVCHSLGGLVVKQVLRAADGRREFSAETRAFLNSVKGIVFIATPHTGSMQATRSIELPRGCSDDPLVVSGRSLGPRLMCGYPGLARA